MSRSRSGLRLVTLLALALAGCTLFKAEASPPPPAPSAGVAVSSGGSESYEATAEPLPSDGVGASSGAYASFTLRQREFIEAQNRYFQRSVDSVTEKCGFSIPSQIDWESFRHEVDRKLDGEMNYSFAGHCAVFVDDLAMLCQNSESARPAIQERVQQYQCSFGGPGARAASLEGGLLHYLVDWEATNSEAFADDFLGRSL